jgi:phosphonate transport system substrate-binding protein
MKTNRRSRYIFFGFLHVVLFASCTGIDSSTPSSYKPVFAADTVDDNTLILGFPSFAYSETAEPLVKYLNAHLKGLQVKLKACTTYEEYLALIRKQEFDFTLINGFQALAVKDSGYTIFGKITNDKQYSAVIFSRKDAQIKSVSDLKGKAIALVPSRIIPGTMMPLYYLHKHGLNVNEDIQRIDVSSFESTILTTYLGKSEAGACLTRSWNVYISSHPEILSRVELKWETPPLVNNALVFKSSLDGKTIALITRLLFSMHTTEEGRLATEKLGISGFEKADDEIYKPMIEFKKRYDSLIL